MDNTLFARNWRILTRSHRAQTEPSSAINAVQSFQSAQAALKKFGFLSLSIALLLLTTVLPCFPYGGLRVAVPLPDGGTLPAYFFCPLQGADHPLPGVVVAVGVGSQLIPQYHDHCRHLADRGFAVLLIDPSNYPESLVPDPYSWDRGMGYVKGSINQGVVAAKLAITDKWYLRSLRAAFDYLCMTPMVDRSRLVLSGFSQPANAALTYACQDPRIRAIVWNYGGSPWVMPYDPMRLPPVLIFHGSEDDVYDVKYAKQLAFELKTNAKYFELCIYPGVKHMFNVYYDLWTENWNSRPIIRESFEHLVSFLNRILMIPVTKKHR
jgi:dienelactone hydrolase